MEQQAQSIFARTLGLFFTYGIRSLTMDELAAQPGISKKTLYQHVRNKGDLVYQTFQYFIEQQRSHVNQIHGENLNAIDELLKIYQQTCKQLQGINRNVDLELKKYYPETWELFVDYKHNFIYQHSLRNLNKGIQEGLYRSDFDHHIITTYYVARIDIFTDNSLFSPEQYSYNQILAELFKYHIRGIGSYKGIAYLEEKESLNL